MTKLSRTTALAALVAAGPSGGALAGPADDTLTWATDRELAVSLPYYNSSREQLIIEQLSHDTLITRNLETGEYEPLLATDWEWVDDLTLDFTLREGVTFHDGSTFGPEDVAYTFNHVAAEDSGVITRANVEWIDNVEVTGENTVRFHLKEPFPAALEFLQGPNPVFPEGLFEDVRQGPDGAPDYGTAEPVGTGPYRVAEVVPGQGVTLERFEDYWGGPKDQASIGTIVFRTLPDPETQLTEVLAGNVDWIWDVTVDQAERLRETGLVQVVNAPTMRVSYLMFDAAGRSGETPFADRRVREAVAHAIDREAIAENLVGETSEVLHAACFPTQFGCTEDVARYEHDPERARELLAEAGYPDGFSTPIYAYRNREFTEAAMADLAAVGIEADLVYQQYQAMVEDVWADEVPLMHSTWGSSSMNDVTAITSHFFRGGRDDYCRDPEVIAALERGDGSTDPEVRREAYAEALTKIAEELCWLPMFSYSKDYVFSNDLDFEPTADEIPRFWTASWKE